MFQPNQKNPRYVYANHRVNLPLTTTQVPLTTASVPLAATYHGRTAHVAKYVPGKKESLAARHINCATRSLDFAAQRRKYASVST